MNKELDCYRRVNEARKREENDDHLTDDELAEIVNECRKYEILPVDTTEAFLSLMFD